MDNGLYSFSNDTFPDDIGQLRGQKRTISARDGVQSCVGKDAWIYCLKCKQHGHLMRDCEKVHQQLGGALANELAQRVVVATAPSASSASKKSRVENEEDSWVYCLMCQQNGHLMPDCKNVRRQLQRANGDEKMEY